MTKARASISSGVNMRRPQVGGRLGTHPGEQHTVTVLLRCVSSPARHNGHKAGRVTAKRPPIYGRQVASPPADLALRGPRVLLRPGTARDAPLLHDIRCDPEVERWWREADPLETIAAELAGAGDEVVLVIQVGGEVAGAIQFYEQNEPDYRHAAIDIYLAARLQRQGLGPEAIRLLATYLIDVLGHHRLTTDPT